MNLQNIFNHIESEDPEFYERTSPRRLAIRTFMKGAALTALPVALGGLLKKAYGQSASDVLSILNFALTLEYLEAEFYQKAVGNASAVGLTGAALGAYTTIRDHEAAHVKFLTATITKLAGASQVAPKPNFDFSGGVGSASGTGNGPFKTVFTNYDVLLAVSQTFEDTGVRAYKGQAANIMDDKYNDVLQAALQIHSVEARHAAHIRYMRANRGGSVVDGNPKPWITQDKSNIQTGNNDANAAIQRTYAGENATNQAGVDIASFVSADLATESFDEPLDKDAVLAIVKPFIITP